MEEMKKETTTNEEGISRRNFVGGVAAVAGVMIVPRHVLGGPGFQAPSDKLNIATIGAGGMGGSNTNRCTNDNIVALCDVDENKAASIYQKYPNAKTYKDYRVMLEKQKDIEAVIIAPPDHMHGVCTMACMQLGKHVYTQKPLTRTIWEARMLTEAAKKYPKVVTQMGNQGHSGEGVRLIEEWITRGAIGKVREVHSWTNRPIWPQGMPRPTDTPPVPAGLDWDLWIGCAPMRPYSPAYHPFSWRSWWDFGGGALADMACHVMDACYSVLKLGYPTSVEATIAYQFSPPKPGGRGYGQRGEYHDSFPFASLVHYNFPARSGKLPAIQYHWYDGGLLPKRPEELELNRKLPESGTIFVGDKGKIMCETYSESPRLIPETKMKAWMAKKPKKWLQRVPNGNHEQNWIDACKGKTKAVSSFDYSGPFSETVLLGNLAIWFPGQKLMWDGPNMKVTNFDEANALVKPKFRDGWSM